MSSDMPTEAMASQQRLLPGGGSVSLWRELLCNRRMVALVLILAVAAVGLNATVQFMRLHFKKESVPMRQRFDQAVPIVLGSWVQVIREEKLEAQIEEALATDQFLLCSYVNAKAIGQSPDALRKRFSDKKTIKEQKAELDKIKADTPAAVLVLGAL